MINFSAEIPVCRSGYYWRPVKSASEPYFVVSHRARAKDDLPARLLVLDYASTNERSHMHDFSDFSDYDPFIKTPGLFRNFAKLDPTEKAIERFANHYGELDHVSPFRASLLQWREQIADMADAVHLWEAIRTGDAESLERHVRWHRGRLGFCSPLASKEMTASKSYARGDLAGPAVELLDFVFNDRANLSCLFPVRLPENLLTFRIRVSTLLNVLWVQFADAVAHDKTYRQCEHCGNEFEIAPGVNRNDKAFCSDSCRVSSYRRRRNIASRLAADGRPLKQVAKEVGTDIETLKKWLQSKGN